MAVPRQLTQISFAAPLDESTEDEVLDPSQGFPVLQNVRQDRRGGVSKRHGFSAITTARQTGGVRAAGRRMFAHRDLTCVIDGTQLDAYSPSVGKSVNAGRVPEVTIDAMPLPASVISAALYYDSVVCNGMLVVAYATISGCRTSVVGIDDGAALFASDSTGRDDNDIFQLGTVGSTVLLVMMWPSSTTVQLWTLDCTSAATVAAGWTITTVASDHKTGTSNISLVTLTDRIAFAYVNSSGGAAKITVRTANASGLIDAVSVGTSFVVPDQVAVGGVQSDTLWVAWNQTTSIHAVGFSPTSLPTTVSSSATIATISEAFGYFRITPLATGAAEVLFDANQDTIWILSWQNVAGTTTFVSSTTAIGASAASVPFVRGGRRYAMFAPAGYNNFAADNHIALADYTSINPTVRPVAYAFPGLCGSCTQAHPVTLSDGRTGCVVAVQTTADSFSYWLLKYNFADPAAWRHAFHNGSTFMSGGLLSYFSGSAVQECGFLHPPMLLDATDAGGSGPTGAVEYVALFEAVDGAGNVSWSGVSDPVLHTGTGAQVTLTSTPLRLTMRSDVRVNWYRTVNGSKTYYFVGAAGATSGSVTDTNDNTGASPLLSQAQLPYSSGVLPGTNGSALQRDAPPFCRDVVSYNGMLVIATRSDLWWSGQTTGGEGTWFSSEDFSLTADGEGDITALAVQDGELFVFKERAIYIVAGDAPSDNGSAGGLGQPRRLAGDVGCIQTTSVVVTSVGIFFRSHRGIELLAGAGRPQWVGEKIARTLATYPYVTSAALDPYNNVVRFSLASGFDASGLVTGEGRDLAFDLVMNDWQSVDDKTGLSAHEASQDACVLPSGTESRYAWLNVNGIVYAESDDYLDQGAWIKMTAESGWFKLAGIQGRQQVNRLLAMMRVRSISDVSISLGYNYSQTYASAQTWTYDQIQALIDAGWPITQLRHDPTNDAAGVSVRVRISDAEPDLPGEGGPSIDGGQGSTWLALTLDITTKDGPTDVPEAAA